MFGKIEVDWKVENLKPWFSEPISDRSKIITKVRSIFLGFLISFDSAGNLNYFKSLKPSTWKNIERIAVSCSRKLIVDEYQ